MTFRPAESSKRIVDFYRNYLLTTFQTNNEEYNKQLKEELDQEDKIAKGPFISMSDSFAKDKSISELVKEGILSKNILNLIKLNPERKLYEHQVEAIKKATAKKNLIVTTGTGSGKTECFLIPVINQLLKEKEDKTLDSGVRTLIVYPMNALVNDQIRRLREIFEDSAEKDITFGRFTGETKEKYVDALKEFKNREGKDPIVNELISRDQMREAPPNILITNYAMLEYLLLRPGDNIFFNETNAKKWKFIVFDEAHSYEGAKGIEVGTLIKRVKSMLERNDVQFILTSATLGGKKDNEKIIKFANLLCNTNFDDNSIIRANSAPPQLNKEPQELPFQLYKDLAEKIRENEKNTEIIKYLKEKNIDIYNELNSQESMEKTLYNMVLSDVFYSKLRECLLNKTKTLHQAAKELCITENDLTDFITVTSNAKLHGDKIFEAKYHMFLRGLEGLFVTLKPNYKLFIKKNETYKENPYDYEDEGYKVFEISFCNNCNAIFITGQTTENGYFIQKSKFSDDYAPEVYLLEGDYDIDEESIDNEDDEYIICAKCGAIKRTSSLKGLDCGHDSSNYNRLIKVKDKGGLLNTCPCCHTFNSQRSIIRPYFLGNEASTAVIATALYNELPNLEISYEIEEHKNSFFDEIYVQQKQIKQEVAKQFLAFSDSRQAAAFFASYLEMTYHNNLIKRLMTYIAELNVNELENGISIEKFVRNLVDLFDKYKIYVLDDREKEAWVEATKEIMNYKAKNSLQNKGILFFDIDVNIPAISKLNLSAEEATVLFKIFILDFIKIGAIKLPISLSKSDSERLTFNGILMGFDKDFTGKSYIKSWLPKGEKDNKRMTLLREIFPKMNNDTLKEILTGIWYELLQRHNVIVLDRTSDKYLLDIKKIKVKAISKLYICPTCKTITPYNLRNICTKCSGHLEEYDYKTELKDNHYYNVFKNLSINNMIAKEHTAQLGSDLAYDYQNQFKKKQINVLSCSTTFEMGVDVGSLETVFMRNMPPSPANYAQRAGRAGRSLNSAAYALTFCPNNSHDLTYYKNPTEMINGTVSPPIFNISNEKIVLRHVFASAFSFFWKQDSGFYKKNIGEFFDVEGDENFKKYLNQNPEKLKQYLANIVDNELYIAFDINNFGWVKRLFSDDKDNPGVFDIAKEKYIEDLNELEKAQKEYLEQALGKKADFIKFSIKTLKEQNLIEFLSRNNLIPKYGFPIDIVELKNNGQGGDVGKLRLDRDLFNAISEYAPESEIVANGKLIKSRYVRVLSGYSWPKRNYIKCDKCQTLNKSLIEDLSECKQCENKLSKSDQKQYIIPKFGFVMENGEPKEVGIEKPERTYKGTISYIGNKNIIPLKKYYEINGNDVNISSSRMDELAVLNTSTFFVCEKCGYAVIDDKRAYQPVVELTHNNSNGSSCSNNLLTRYSIGHEFQTDVVVINFLSKDISDTHPESAWTILYSLLEGLSRYLLVNRNELSGCLHWYKNEQLNSGNFGFVLFDNTPGGAGYVRQLVSNPEVFIGMLKYAKEIVERCDCGGEEKNTACYNCLCNYYNQKQHDILKRKYAIDFYDSMLNNKDTFLIKEGSAKSSLCNHK